MTKTDRVKFEAAMLASFDKLAAMEGFGGAVHSLTTHEAWLEATGQPTNPNLVTPEAYVFFILATPDKKMLFD